MITRYEGRVLTARIQNGKVIQMDLEPSEASGRLGNIYIGKVKNIVKNINAAFVDLGGGQMGYYSLSDNESHLFTQPGRTGALREGDEILVQVSRDAVKTKAPVLTSNLNFPGRYSVLTVGKTAAGVSAKIKDAGERQRLKEIAGRWSGDSCGAILRTNAAGVPEEVLEEELSLLKKRMEQTLKEGTMRTCYSCLCREMPSYINGVRDARPEELEEILTDDGDIFEELTRYLEESRPEELPKLVLYDDQRLRGLDDQIGPRLQPYLSGQRMADGRLQAVELLAVSYTHLQLRCPENLSRHLSTSLCGILMYNNIEAFSCQCLSAKKLDKIVL